MNNPRTQQLKALTILQRQYEAQIGSKDGIIMIDTLDQQCKHIFSGPMRDKICRAIARILEQERYTLINKQ